MAASSPASSRKAVVERYFDGFRASDHGLVLGLLTADVVPLANRASS